MQLKEYNKAIKKVEKRIQKEIEEINNVYTGFFNGWSFSENFKINSLKRFLKYLSKQEIIDSLSYACSLINNKDNSIRYFCGICWNKIREKTDPNYDKERQIRKCWNSQLKGSHYLDDKKIKKWINEYSLEKIILAMNNAQGYWKNLKEALDGPH